MLFQGRQRKRRIAVLGAIKLSHLKPLMLWPGGPSISWETNWLAKTAVTGTAVVGRLGITEAPRHSGDSNKLLLLVGADQHTAGNGME